MREREKEKEKTMKNVHVGKERNGSEFTVEDENADNTVIFVKKISTIKKKSTVLLGNNGNSIL